jgi:hypothetical protein
MPDTIGRITVPMAINSGQAFPLITHSVGFAIERLVGFAFFFPYRLCSRSFCFS